MHSLHYDTPTPQAATNKSLPLPCPLPTMSYTNKIPYETYELFLSSFPNLVGSQHFHM